MRVLFCRQAYLEIKDWRVGIAAGKGQYATGSGSLVSRRQKTWMHLCEHDLIYFEGQVSKKC